jgi:hypothetical protein
LLKGGTVFKIKANAGRKFQKPFLAGVPKNLDLKFAPGFPMKAKIA